MKRFVTLILTPAALTLVAATPGDTLRPGKWSYEVRMGGIQLGDSTNVRTDSQVISSGERCLTAEDVQQPERWLLMGMDRGCTLNDRAIKNGAINSSISCPNALGGARTDMEGRGTYTPNTYAMSSSTRVSGLLPSVTGQMTMAGRRIGTCS